MTVKILSTFGVAMVFSSEQLTLAIVSLCGLVILVLIILIFVFTAIGRLMRRAEQQDAQFNELIQQSSLSRHDTSTAYNQILASQQHLLEITQRHFHQNDLKIEQLLTDFKMKMLRQIAEFNSRSDEKNAEFRLSVMQTLDEQHLNITKALSEQKQQLAASQLSSLEKLIEQLNQTALQNRDELAKSVEKSSEQVSIVLNRLSNSTDQRLKEISGQVDKRLSEGFDKTTKTFNDILQRLALIDDAQKKITELSSNVVSLQEVLSDKRSRGAFGEVQLNALVRNVLPEQHFSVQHMLSNGKVADCIIKLPQPTGNIVIDAKFPLESFKTMMNEQLSSTERKIAERQFKVDIKKHVNDIADKYLIEGETADGAVMFIPAEAVFAEIHAHHPDLVEMANLRRVWLTSPTTLMAVLTTARSVLKDEATRKQVHIIQQHLVKLSGDFSRFKGRFNNLAKHIDQAASDVKLIHTSANKISDRFEKIENVDFLEESLSKIADKANA